MELKSAYERMISRVKSKTNNDLMSIWRALEEAPCCPTDPWDPVECNLTMDDWMLAINSEIEKRGIRNANTTTVL